MRGRLCRILGEELVPVSQDAPALTPVEGPARLTPLIHQAIAAHAQHRPDAVAIQFPDSSIRYSDLDTSANQLAHRLRDAGVQPDTVVAVYLPRQVDHYVALLAVLKAGGGYLPLDPGYPPRRLRHMLADSAARVLVTNSTVAELPDCPPVVIDLTSDAAEIARQPRTAPPDQVTADNLAYLTYTSASTGTPKGAMVSHGGLANLCHWHGLAYDLSAADRSALLSPLSFDGSALDLWPALMAGGSAYCVPDQLRTDVRALVETFASRGVTIAFLTTALGELFFDQPGIAELPLRTLLVGGETLHRRPPAGLPFQVFNIYGPTEASMYITAAALAPATAAASGPIPIGWPIHGVHLHLRDAAGNEAASGEVGELCIGGVAVGRGYIGAPELTEQRFPPDPCGPPGARMYGTGDLVRRRADGALEFHGRQDRQVKVRGHRIELEEVEAGLVNHPEVARAVAVVAGSGAADAQLIGYVVPRHTTGGGSEGLPARVRAYLSDRLPRYCLPDAVVVVEDLPLNLTGKVDRAALPPAAPLPPATTPPAELTAAQRLVAEAVADTLGQTGIGLQDNLFDRGAHSLTLVLVASRLTADAGVDIPLRDLFTQPTVAAIAERLEEAILAEPMAGGAAESEAGAVRGR